MLSLYGITASIVLAGLLSFMLHCYLKYYYLRHKFPTYKNYRPVISNV
jgi:hypothetical protein